MLNANDFICQRQRLALTYMKSVHITEVNGNRWLEHATLFTITRSTDALSSESRSHGRYRSV